jgi:hypothetical protein
MNFKQPGSLKLIVVIRGKENVSEEKAVRI